MSSWTRAVLLMSWSWLAVMSWTQVIGSYRSEERRGGKEGRYWRDWSSDVCSSDLAAHAVGVDELLDPGRLVDVLVVAGGDVLDPGDRLVQIGRASGRERG